MALHKQPWLALEQRLEQAFQQIFQERVLVEPRQQGDFARTLNDDSRPLYLGPAVYRLQEPYDAAVERSAQRVRYAQASVDIERAALPSGWRFFKNDVVTRLDAPERPQFAVSRVEEDFSAFIRLTLGPIAEAA